MFVYFFSKTEESETHFHLANFLTEHPISSKDLFTQFWYDLIDENVEGKICPGKLVMMDTNFTKKLLFLMHFYLTIDQS